MLQSGEMTLIEYDAAGQLLTLYHSSGPSKTDLKRNNVNLKVNRICYTLARWVVFHIQVFTIWDRYRQRAVWIQASMYVSRSRLTYQYRWHPTLLG